MQENRTETETWRDGNVMTYDLADKAIRDMNKRNLRSFDRLKTLKFDEMNIFRTISEVYEASARIARRRYFSIAYYAYIAAMVEAGIAERDAKKAADESIVEDWIIEMMDEDNETTLYKFNTEKERKIARLTEALTVAHNKIAEIEKALRYWTLQLAQYADESVFIGTVHGFMDAGVKKVRWIAVNDRGVCKECWDRNGRIYPIDEVPGPAHFRCRCRLEPVR